jgi:hypothetical protein
MKRKLRINGMMKKMDLNLEADNAKIAQLETEPVVL